jgi:hypothetical protein
MSRSITFDDKGEIIVIKDGEIFLDITIDNLPAEADEMASVTAKMQAILQNL